VTTIETPAAVRHRVPVLVTGSIACEPELRELLERQPDVEVVGWQSDIHRGPASLEGAEAKVILHGVTQEDDPGQLGVRTEVQILREHTAAPIVLLASAASPELLEEALQAGVSDVLVVPQMLDTVSFAVQKASQNGRGHEGEPAAHRGQVITVFSPKGGTGKTVMSTSLAAAAARHGKRVLVVDLDLQFGDASMMLGLTPKTTIFDLVQAPGELDGEKLTGYTARHATGLHVLPAPLEPEKADAVGESKVAEILDVARATYDVVVLDTSPFFYGPLLATLDPTDRLLVLCGLDAPTMKNVRLGLRTLELLSYPSERIDLVLNRVVPNGNVTKQQVETVLERSVRFELPEDPSVLDAVNRGALAALIEERTPFAGAVREIAASLIPTAGRSSASPDAAKRRFLGRMR
jgi:pilus assembly protein CpaE